jgi:mannose-6-phosphate isomerase-like protein (cupin superfamily)
LEEKINPSKAWPWSDSLDAVVAAGKHHRVLLENDRVRVLEVRIPRGDTVPVHTHRWPSTIYVAKASHFIRRDGDGNVLIDTRSCGAAPEEARAEWVPPLPPHSVENVGDSDILLISTELKGLGG